MSELDASAEHGWTDATSTLQPTVKNLITTLEARPRVIYTLMDQAGWLERPAGST
jgi:hypothetical protein